MPGFKCDTFRMEFSQPTADGIDMKKTGKKLKQLCLERGVTAKMIKSKLYIGSLQSVYAWFSGKALPSLDHMYLLGRVLGTAMDEMVVGASREMDCLLEVCSMKKGWDIMMVHRYHRAVAKEQGTDERLASPII